LKEITLLFRRIGILFAQYMIKLPMSFLKKGKHMQTSTGLLGRIISKTGLLKPGVQKERRCSKRYRLDLPIRFRIYLPSCLDRSSPFLRARLYDLSELGVGLLTNTMEYGGLNIMDPSRETSEHSRLEIELPYGEGPLRLHGKAIWYLRNPEGHPYVFRIGVQFHEISMDQKKAIQRLIQLYYSGVGESWLG
jgi:hypothetical protein